MYLEASARQPGDNAILNIPIVTSAVDLCLTFYYHMYGHHIGVLRVMTESGGAIWEEVGDPDVRE